MLEDFGHIAPSARPKIAPMNPPDYEQAAPILEEILGETDILIRRRLQKAGLELPHLVIAGTPTGQVVLLSNVSADVLRSLAST